MKLAILFNGHLRTWRNNDTIVDRLVRQYPDADVFCQTFRVRNLVGNKWHQDEGEAGQPVVNDDIFDIIKWLQPVHLCVSPCDSGADMLPLEFAGVGFRWSKQRVCEIRQDFETRRNVRYDCVFIARYDLGFDEPVILPETLDPETVYGGYNANQERQGNDGEVFVYGAPQVIDALMCPAVRPELASEVPAMGFIGETLVTKTRKLLGLKYQPHKIKHFLYRTGGERLYIEQ